MVAESLKPSASVAMVAQRYGVNANLLFTWRRQEAAEAPSAASVAAPSAPPLCTR